MTTFTAEDFDAVRDAGITQQEFATMTNVSRATALYWINGKKQPMPNNAVIVQKYLDRIKELLATRDLPVSPRLRGEARKAKIFSLVKEDVTK